MTDLHTHILPGIDDGAQSVEESLAMLRMERSQGVDTVVLTPHFYRDRENPKRFLRRRQESAAVLARRVLALSEQEREELPQMLLGAEVAWWPNMADWEELPEMCIGDTKNLLLELPFTPWNDQMIYQLHELFGRTGITPIIAHLERYLKNQRPEYIQEVLGLGVPIQISGDILLRPFARSGAMKLLQRNLSCVVASDCHRSAGRAPNLEAAMDLLRRKLGNSEAEAMIRRADELLSVKRDEIN